MGGVRGSGVDNRIHPASDLWKFHLGVLKVYEVLAVLLVTFLGW